MDAGAKNVPVGKTIAMLAEEGDDISTVEVPTEDAKPASKAESVPKEKKESAPETSPSGTSGKTQKAESAPPPSSSSASSTHHEAPDLGRPLFPSVARLLIENGVTAEAAKSIKGTGMRGMLTKGDVLSFLGKASGPMGTYKAGKEGVAAQGRVPTAGTKQASSPSPSTTEDVSTKGLTRRSHPTLPDCGLIFCRLHGLLQPLKGESVRSMIFAGLASASHASRARDLASRTPSRQQQVGGVEATSTGGMAGRSLRAFNELLDDYDFKKGTGSGSGSSSSGSSGSSSGKSGSAKKAASLSGLL